MKTPNPRQRDAFPDVRAWAGERRTSAQTPILPRSDGKIAFQNYRKGSMNLVMEAAWLDRPSEPYPSSGDFETVVAR